MSRLTDSLKLPALPGGCTGRDLIDGQALPCEQPPIVEGVLIDRGCPDDPGDGPHVMTVRYCRHHEDMAGPDATPISQEA